MKTEKVVNLLICIGAAIVILGAWAKIVHRPYADLMLTIGLVTEAALFLITGIYEWFKKLPQEPVATHDKFVSQPQDNTALTLSLDRLNGTITRIFKN